MGTILYIIGYFSNSWPLPTKWPLCPLPTYFQFDNRKISRYYQMSPGMAKSPLVENYSPSFINLLGVSRWWYFIIPFSLVFVILRDFLLITVLSSWDLVGRRKEGRIHFLFFSFLCHFLKIQQKRCLKNHDELINVNLFAVLLLVAIIIPIGVQIVPYLLSGSPSFW